ncbi:MULTISPECIES: XopG/HopH/AvrPtoH family type III secretion system effector [Xanthomonas]|uniref:Type III secretion system effector protein n=5 Tax=Xanthomonas hortorum TaxID=56454 RepID=A0A6V7E7E9_9XANT|nr:MULTISPECIES: type III secretion system effector protein [Xanthomonas]MCC4626950.1 type III secretion system effector protein [Xanthomonas campestris pv. nigromaculans]APP79814.1 type III effector HopH1 [Xanthomonas hortorum pv. gardneri]EGD16643.1 Xanthomonas outer protein G [Xanthomonas hortorum ATCC 19865]MCC5091242.1 type III secretion system effector protein [Xanthomonas campestris]MCC8500642.1 type III secretion system effector protein [Xanthomonas hortorum pv. gardneri]
MPIQTNYPGIYSSSQTSSQENQFKGQVESALGKIAEGGSGNSLLQGLKAFNARENRNVIIKEIPPTDQPNTFAILSARQVEEHRDSDGRRASTLKKSAKIAKKLAKEGVGCNAMVEWNPHSHIELNGNGSPVRIGSNADEAFVVLAHELVHARHLLAGTSTAYDGGDRYDERSEAGKEELRAVGIGEYDSRTTGEPSENSIRQEHGLPIRKKYKSHGM